VTAPKRGGRTVVSSAHKLASNLYGIYKACGLLVALAYLGNVFATIMQVVRSGTLVSADRKMVTRNYRWTVQGVSIELDGRLWPAAREMYGRSVYFPSREYYLQPDTVVVDLGSNVGLFSILAAKIGCRVVAVEGQIGLVRQMQALLARLGLTSNVWVDNALIGSSRGVFRNIEQFLALPDVEGMTPEITLPELLEKYRIQEIDLLKMDIEGSEFALFSGNVEWLSKVRRIAAEIHTEFGEPEEILNVLHREGFKTEIRDERLRRVKRILGPSGYMFAVRRI
jgi:FkbM family methyltransferase